MTTHPPRYVDYLPLDHIQHASRNPKGHADTDISRSIDHFGFAELPLLDERTGRLVAGHGRHNQLVAMQQAGKHAPDGIRIDDTGAWLMPVIRGWASRSDSDADAYLVASNQLVTKGGWEDHSLAEILEELQDQHLLDLTGFDDDDLAQLLDGLHEPDEPTDSEPGEPGASAPPEDPVTKPGDVWILGPHRIICGDSRDHDTVTAVLDGARINLAVTSPPYASRRSYDPSSGFQPIPPDEYVDWFTEIQANVRAHLADDGSWFVNIKEHTEDGQRHLYVKDLTIAHVRRWGWRFIDELSWHKTDPFPGRYEGRFKNAFEPVFHFAIGQPKHRPDHVLLDSNTAIVTTPTARAHATQFSNETLRTVSGTGKVWPSNVLTLAAGAEGVDGGSHAAAFPVRLPAWFINAYTDPGDTVFDPFMGSGTTLIAADNEGRIGYGVEISPAYCDVICRRYQQHTGTVPVLQATGTEHDFVTDSNG